MREPKKGIYNAVWFFYKKYIDGDRSDQYWQDVHQESERLVKQFSNDRFARELLGAVINEFARRE